MKFKSLAFALLVIPLVTTAVQAQNLFATGRPAYTRDYPATYHDRYLASANRSALSSDVNYDRERLNRAWENYQAEADRYQTRYGSNGAVRPVVYDANSSVDANFRPPRRCSGRHDASRARLPASTTPSGYYNPSYYGTERDLSNGSTFGFGSSGFGSTDPYGNDLSRTASRPVANFFSSLFGTNR